MTAKRRLPGEGSLYWVEKRQRYCAARTVGTDVRGRPRRVVAYGLTKTEAIGKLARKLDELGGQAAAVALPPSSSVTLSQWVEQWLTARGAGLGRPLRPATAASYRSLLELHVLPSLGHRRLATLRPAHVEDLLLALLRNGWQRERPDEDVPRGLSARSVRYVLQVLRACLRHAVRRDLIRSNPCDGVQLPEADERRPASWSADEAARFLETARSTSRLATLYLLALGTGLRRGELVALTWSDVDLEAGVLTVRATRSATGLEGEPKTRAGRRDVPLPPDLVDELRRHRERQTEERKTGLEAGVWTDTGAIFATGTGRPVSARNVNRDLERTISHCIPPVRRIPVHGLRHTHATLALRAGVPAHVVAARLGHADPTITLRIYAHVLADQARAAALPLSRLLAPTLDQAEADEPTN